MLNRTRYEVYQAEPDRYFVIYWYYMISFNHQYNRETQNVLCTSLYGNFNKVSDHTVEESTYSARGNTLEEMVDDADEKLLETVSKKAKHTKLIHIYNKTYTGKQLDIFKPYMKPIFDEHNDIYLCKANDGFEQYFDKGVSYFGFEFLSYFYIKNRFNVCMAIPNQMYGNTLYFDKIIEAK